MSLFVDTSVWYAAADSSDASNARAKEILSGGDPLVTSDHVLVETWTLLRWRIHREAAERFWSGIATRVAASGYVWRTLPSATPIRPRHSADPARCKADRTARPTGGGRNLMLCDATVIRCAQL